ncbi:ATP-binding protein [Streptomyces sp. SID14478]|uniref:ATP-binding protein n=1 Tax=Streptomyces sp. SID14478 TaxID=2706073 RepID=UPI0013DEC644|nr:ATP-binding protein [Streptomyces sp. SID14478]NEB81912.1 ATP-binding protein [Streptomyces sp. SID14478]
MNAPVMEADRVTCPEARNRVRTALEPLCAKLPPAQAERLRQDACLVTSELVTNAMLHGGGIEDFHAYLDGKVLTVRVRDHSTKPPTPLPRAPGSGGGYGWLIIRRLSTHLDIQLEAHGKTVTADFDPELMPV